MTDPTSLGSALGKADEAEQRRIWERQCPALLALADQRLAIIGALFEVLNGHPELTGEVVSAIAALSPDAQAEAAVP